MKRVLAIVIVTLSLCANIVPVVFAYISSSNPFADFDERRTASIIAGSGTNIYKQNPSVYKAASNATRYAVKFKSSTPLSDIYNCVSEYDYSLLANSDVRVFALRINNLSDFRDKYSDIVEFIEEDQKLSLSAVVNDPMYDTQWELESINANNAWDIAIGNNDVVVAVLDSGIYRGHEDFENTTVLAGYDTVTDTEGVNADYNGHGTKITSIIAASNNNSVGMASLGAGLTILPIRVSDSTGFVYSTDFIQALYFAADSGADVINMSFGGYVYSAAEEAAVEYAASKGCILVAAAGNEGTDIKYAGMKAYPASYSNVISVGSVNSRGEHCSFSQYNDAVDLVAPGEELTVANAYGEYEIENGTSFSTAYVSALIGVAFSAIDDEVRFTSDQFVTLIATLNGSGRSDNYGYGFINAAAVLSEINRPLYSGVIDGGVYHKNINIYFNRGTATLDGEKFLNGDMVLVSGKHELKITEEEETVTVSFITDNIPLHYEYVEGVQSSSISFNRGSATLDGVPYLSGAPIITSGKHLFVLTGPYGNSREFSFESNFNSPTVFGVTNGGYYTAPVCITTTESETLLLNDTPFTSGNVVATNGTYKLSATKNNHTTTVYFTIANPQVGLYNSSVTSGKIAIDDEYNKVYLYNEIISGLRTLNSENYNQTESFLRTEASILSHAFYGQYLVLLHSNGFSVVSRADLANGTATPVFYKFSHIAIDATIANDRVIYVSDHTAASCTLRSVNIENGSEALIAELSDNYKFIAYNEGITLLSTADGIVSGYDNDWKRTFRYSTGYAASCIVFEGDVFTTGNVVYNSATKSSVFSYDGAEKPISIFNGVLITNDAVYDVEQGIRIGKFEKAINSIALGKNKVYKCLDDTKLEVIILNSKISANNAVNALNAGNCTSAFATGPEALSVFAETVKLSTNVDIVSADIDSKNGVIYAISETEQALYCFDAKTLSLIKCFGLRYTPSYLYHDGTKLYLSFSNSATLCVLNGIEAECEYYATPRAYTKIKFVKDKVFGLTTAGDLYSFSPSIPQSTDIVIKNQQVVDFTAGSEYIYTLLKSGAVSLIYKISINDYTVKATASVNTDNYGIIATDDYVFIGNKVFDKENLRLQSTIPETVCYADNNYILTTTALYSTDNFELLGKHSYDTSLPIFDEGYNYYSFYGSTVLKVESFNTDLSTLPEIKGVASEETLKGPVSPLYDYGVGFVDGAQISSGDLIENGGRHTLTVCLPFGVYKSVNFYIEAVINRINLNYGKAVIGVNESLIANVSAFPLPNNKVDTLFSADNGNVAVYEDGTVIGVTPGTCTITATTVDGLHSATFTFTVVESNICFDSSYFKEKDGKVVGSISPGTGIETMLSAVSETYGTVIPATRDNIHLNSGVITTDMKALLYNINGELIDERFLSVVGDVDCDGFITANDYYVLGTLSAQPESMSPAVKDAADVDGNGNIDAFDELALKEHLLCQNIFTESSTAVKRTARASLHLLAPENLTDGTTFTAGITLTDAQNISGISGIIRFDSASYTVTDFNVLGKESNGFYTIESDGIYFFSKCNPALETQVVATVSFNVTKGIIESPTPFISVDQIVIYDGNAATISSANVVPKVTKTPVEDIKIFNMPDFAFNNEILYYTMDLPRASSEVYISAYPNERFNITGNTQFVGGTAEFSAITENDGGEVKYNFICNTVQADIPVTGNTDISKNTNASINFVDITNGTLLPQFSKTITEYFVLCNDPNKVIISAFPETETSVVEVGLYDKATKTIIVTCTAEGGAFKTYTFRLEKTSKFTPEEQSGFGLEKWVWICVGFVAALLLVFITYNHIKSIGKHK